MGKAIGSLIVGYLVIGGIVFLVQLGLPVLYESHCFGRVQHSLTDRYFPPRNPIEEAQKTLTGKKEFSDNPWTLRAGLHIAQWLPDLYSEVIAGEMKLANYLRGGYRCNPTMDIPTRKLPVASRGERQPLHLGAGDAPTIDEVLRETAKEVSS